MGFTAVAGIAAGGATACSGEDCGAAVLVIVPAGLLAVLDGLSAWYGFRNGRCCRRAHQWYRAGHRPKVFPRESLDYDSPRCQVARRHADAESDPPKRFELYRRMPDGCRRPSATKRAPLVRPAPSPDAGPELGPPAVPAPPPGDVPASPDGGTPPDSEP